MRVGRLDQTIVNPFAFAPRRHHTGAPKVCKMTGNLWLIYLQDFDKEANTNLIVPDQIDQPKTCLVGERLEQKCKVVGFVCQLICRCFCQCVYYDFCLSGVPILTQNLS